MAKRTEERVEALLTQILADTNLELVDVEYVKEGDWHLRVFLDKAGGIEIDDCQQVSQRLGEMLDDAPWLSEAYVLEVSSPGLDRPLKKPRDFQREQGKKIDITFYAPQNGKRQLTGVLAGFDETTKEMILSEGMRIPLAKVAQVRLHIDF